MNKKNLKILLMLFCISIVLLSTGCSKNTKDKAKQSKSIKIICEDTVLPMVSDLVHDYNLNNDTTVTVESTQRENAFDALNSSNVDLLIGYVIKDNSLIENLNSTIRDLFER
jgi:predicted component of type VI protein secretion system